MAVTGVSTYAVFQSTLNDVNRVSSALAESQRQLSSGFASQDFAGMASQTQQYLSLDATIAKIDQYLADNKVVEARINTTSSVLDQTISVANSLQSLITQRISGISNSGAFETQITGMWQQIVGQLNTTIGGQYLFSGTRTDSPAVDAENFPTLEQPGVPDSNYYLGSNQDMTARPQESTIVSYNVRADAPAFQKIFAALSLAKQGNASNDTEKLQQAADFMQQGLQEVISIQATVNANKVQFTSIDSNLENNKLYWKGLRESIGNTDMVAVSTQVAVNQGILQATFQSFSRIVSLRLSDYLK